MYFPILAQGGAIGVASPSGPSTPGAGALWVYQGKVRCIVGSREVGGRRTGQVGSWGPPGSLSS